MLDDGAETAVEFVGFREECLMTATIAAIARTTTNATDHIVFAEVSGFRLLFGDVIRCFTM
jgi:hypothetical protein